MSLTAKPDNAKICLCSIVWGQKNEKDHQKNCQCNAIIYPAAKFKGQCTLHSNPIKPRPIFHSNISFLLVKRHVIKSSSEVVPNFLVDRYNSNRLITCGPLVPGLFLSRLQTDATVWYAHITFISQNFYKRWDYCAFILTLFTYKHNFLLTNFMLFVTWIVRWPECNVHGLNATDRFR